MISINLIEVPVYFDLKQVFLFVNLVAYVQITQI